MVCETRAIPANAIAAEAGWNAFRIKGTLDFGMVGVIAKISEILAYAGVSLFVVSTYNTDYVFIKSYDYERSIALLRKNSYTVG